jgi:hypothetical protein
VEMRGCPARRELLKDSVKGREQPRISPGPERTDEWGAGSSLDVCVRPSGCCLAGWGLFVVCVVWFV